MSKTSSRKAPEKRAHVRTLADGTTKTYFYDKKPKAPAQPRYSADSVGALIMAYKRSPEWARLRPVTQRTYLIYMREAERMGAMRVADVKRRLVLEMRDAMASTRGPGAASGFMRVASSLFSWAVERGWIDHSPVRGAKALPGGHLPAWTAEEAERAMRELPEPYRRVVVLALYTGQRRGDLVALRWSAYDGHAIRLRQSKTGVALAVPAHAVLRAELETWRRDAESPHILTQASGKPWGAIELSQKLPRALRAIGLPAGLNVHGLRKLAAARLADAGCTPHEIASITGHRSLRMVELYTASASQEKLAQSALARLETAAAKAANPVLKP